ncbi:hypothetical protein L596_013469 [Steinernema carpocapsae]|uniref:Uncharacterized protein n=1 Tax=Steinernema carpocapsae TaxID=34508 RepID=A0A4U5P0R2_STECR|nr:hypothetical protein L596_013469 [Steinernema carpocapsae]
MFFSVNRNFITSHNYGSLNSIPTHDVATITKPCISITYPNNKMTSLTPSSNSLLNTKSNPPRCSVVSPFSICLALAVAGAGAREKT